MMGVLNEVADTILEKPVRVTVQILHPRWWERIWMKFGWLTAERSFDIKPATLGNLIRISELMLSVDGVSGNESALDMVYQLYRDGGDKVAQVVAIGISNSKHDPPEKLIRFVKENFTAEDLTNVAMVIIRQMDVSNFIRTITLARGVSLLKTEGTIASGGQ